MKEIKYEEQTELHLNNEKIKVYNYNRYYVIVINLSDETVHVSKYCDIESRIGTSDVLTLEPGKSGYISTAKHTLDGFFAIGNGKIRIIPSNSEEICVTIVNALTISNETIKPNLLINPDFRINQRKSSGKITTPGYFVDCWKLISGSVTVNADGTLTLDGTIAQTLETTAGADVAVSSSAGTPSYNDADKTFTLSASGEIILWAKLENGDFRTQFIPPEPASETLKCQRFYQRYYANEMSRAFRVRDGVYVIDFHIPPMRVNPLVSYHWKFGSYDNILEDANNAPHNAVFTTSPYTDRRSVKIDISTDATTQTGYIPADDNSYCELTAEI